MSRLVAIVCLSLALLFLVGCGGEPADKPAAEHAQPSADAPAAATDAFANLSGTIDIAGGTAHIPVMEKAAREIMTAHPSVVITVAGGGSGVGAQKVGEGLVQIGNTGRSLSEEEVQQYGLISYPFAVDGVCAVIHPSNPVKALTSEQLQAAFAGKITSWKELGGPDKPIHLFTRDEASGTRKVFWKKALSKGEIASGANVVASNGAMKTAVSQDPDALGYVSVGHLDSSIKAPSLDGVMVTQANAASGKYPVTRKLYMNTKGEPDELTAAFIAFIDGPRGAEIIQDSGYIPLKEDH